MEITVKDGKAVLVFFSTISLSNVADTGLGMLVTRTSDKYFGKYTEIIPLNGITISLNENILSIDSKTWLRITVVTL